MFANSNCQEVIDIAIQIEKNGYEFYTEAMNTVKSKDLKERLATLANWEDKHIKKMQDLHKLFPEDEEPFIFPDIDPAGYVQSLGAGHVFHKNSDVSSQIRKTSDDREILELARKFEKDSVVFYEKIKSATNNRDAQLALDMIMKEEISHVEFIEKLIAEK